MLYRAAYNSAWDAIKDPAERRGDASREEVAHRVAWAAVGQTCEKRESGHRRKQ
jgi:cation transport regulator